MNSLIQDLRLSAIVPAIRHEVAAPDKNAPVPEISAMKGIIAGPVLQGQTVMWLLCAFAALVLILAAIGIYSVISYAVTQRTHELGIWMARDADRRAVVNLVVEQVLFLAMIGVVTGLAGALGNGPFRLQLAVRGAMVVAVRCAADRDADVRQRVRNPDHRGLLGPSCTGPTRGESRSHGGVAL
jgi:hypothetical protein